MSSNGTKDSQNPLDKEEVDEEFDDLTTELLPNGEFGRPNGEQQQKESQPASAGQAEAPKMAKNDKTLSELLELMDGDFAPIIPDAVTDYYLSKNGFQTSDTKVKRLLALATQKFISDIAQDAYEHSRIRSTSALYNSSNPQLRAKQLLQGQQFANQQNAATGAAEGQAESQTQSYSNNAGNQQGKVVLTMEDLSNALSEYGVNASRPDFYR